MTSNKRILVVDDAVIWSDVVAAFFRHNGYDVAVARDGGAALALARDWSPDVIILDLVLPNTDGTAFLRELRTGRPPLADVPVVVVSGVVNARTAAEVAALGVHQHLVKAQHSLRELLDSIRGALPGHSRRAA